MPVLSKKITALFILLSFLMIVFWGFMMMTHRPSGEMNNSCPFAIAGASLCPQDNMMSVIHHISSYQSFLNTPIGSSAATLLISLLLFAVAIIFATSPPLLKIPARVPNIDNSPPDIASKRKVTRWLSLFENSPSLS